ncbi:RING-type E3 ubiquitin transferase [Ranunculus cassubicifolius]
MSTYPQFFDLDLALTFDFDTPLDDPIQNSSTMLETDSIFADLPKISITEGECMICMGDFVGEKHGATQMPCSHSYHSTCISRWLSQYNSCPLCRSPVCKS